MLVVSIAAVAHAQRNDSARNTSAQTGGGGAERAWQPPRTPWGDPDLRGMWPLDYINGTPVQRAPEHGERRYLTDEEFAERSARLAALNARYEEEIASRRMDMGH